MYQRSMATVNELEGQFGALWTQCQRCQGSLHQVRTAHTCAAIAQAMAKCQGLLPGASCAGRCPVSSAAVASFSRPGSELLPLRWLRQQCCH